MADIQKKLVDDLPPVTLPMTGNENIMVSQAGVMKIMKPGDFPATVDGYIKGDGSTPFSGDQSMSGNRITNIGSAAGPADAAKWGDVINLVSWTGNEW